MYVLHSQYELLGVIFYSCYFFYQASTSSTWARHGISSSSRRGLLLPLRTHKTSSSSRPAPTASVLSSSSRSTLAPMPSLGGTPLVPSPISSRPLSASLACSSLLTQGLTISQSRSLLWGTSRPLPSATLTLPCGMSISASQPTTRGGTALDACSGFWPGWFCR
ncbi:40S ribosomal protein Sa-1 [Zea mays]|uniref:40S ribosomal protein Sa-1 n=1 Tax=Zea mays TaxID=4577 RepID=A0A1D6PIR2_MAIZE|nr:40S ribosomal protein Sa-1 [Zea mays]AQL09211.1 40S ribosomal protein Sa-1 [Zea mays]